MEVSSRVNRREFLRVGGVAALAAMPIFQRVSHAVGAERAKYHKILYVHLDGGGPSGFDSFDPKNHSPSVDSIYYTQQTAIPGEYVTALYPETAKRLDRIALFRARRASSTDHQPAMASMLQRDASSGQHLLTSHAKRTMGTPFAYAETPNVINGFDYRKNSLSVPLSWELQWSKDRNEFTLPKFHGVVDDERRSAREQLRNTLQHAGEPFTSSAIEQHEHYREVAHRLIANAQDAVTFSPEDLARYGGGRPTPAAIGTLAMRELLRRDIVGAAMIRNGFSVTHGGWDHHTKLVEDMDYMGPETDRILSALIDDVDNGVLPDTLVVVDTEFGRTRHVNNGGGRDHDTTHWSMLMGSNVQHGVIYGSTNKRGEADKDVVTDELFSRVVHEAAIASGERDQVIRGQVPVFRS